MNTTKGLHSHPVPLDGKREASISSDVIIKPIQPSEVLSQHRRRLLFVILPTLYILGIVTGLMLLEKPYLTQVEHQVAVRTNPSFEPLTIPGFLQENAFTMTLSKQNLSSPDELIQWQKQTQSQARVLLGLTEAPEAITEWHAEKVINRNGYQETRLIVTAADGDEIIVYRLDPEEINTPAAAILVIPGSGAGVAGAIGRIQDYQQGIGVSLVQQGYVVYAIENRGWGERTIDVGSSEYQPSAVYATYSIQRGTPLASRYVTDVGTVLQLIEDNPEVDPDRIGLVGCSLGGTIATWAGALYPRVATVVVASGLTQDSTMPEHHASDQMIVPGKFAYFDDTDIAALIAPRPLLLTFGLAEEGRYGIEARTQRTFEHLEPIWTMLGAAENLDFMAHPGYHTYDVAATLEFLNSVLLHD